MNDIELSFELGLQNIKHDYSEVWLEITNCMKSVIYLSNQGEYRFKVNWEPLIKYINEKSTGGLILTCNILPVAHEKLEARHNYSRHILENFLYDLFIVANIAKPHSCNFWNAKIPDYFIVKNNELQCNDYRLGLDDSLFYSAKRYLDNNINFDTDYLSIRKIWSWYRRVFPSIVQIAETPLQRAIFSIMQVSQFEQLYVPISTIWLCQAVESLYNVSDSKILRQRICKFLNVPENKIKMISDELREAFKLRHSFAHGGGVVPHPSYNEVLDLKINNLIVQQMNTVEILSGVVIGTIRQMAIRNWINLSFADTIEGY